MNSSVTSDTLARQACVRHRALFLHPLVEDDQPALPPAQQKAKAALTARACALCAKCPLRQQCLYDAVIRFNVSGVVGGTTPAVRNVIRRRLGWRVEPDNFDALLGITNGQHVNHDDVIRARQSNPQESLQQLADRLGCSLSTVKRHLRQEREASPSRPHLHLVPPALEQVEQALLDVTGSTPLSQAA